MQVIEIRINCPSQNVAEDIARSLLKRRLIAAANMLQDVRSFYHWKGTIECASEVPLLIKTRTDLFDHVVRQVRALHPYETPSITATVIDYVNDDYRDWVLEETAGARLD